MRFWQDFTLKPLNFIEFQNKLIFEDFNVYGTEKLFITLVAHISPKKNNFERKVEKNSVFFGFFWRFSGDFFERRTARAVMRAYLSASMIVYMISNDVQKKYSMCTRKLNFFSKFSNIPISKLLSYREPFVYHQLR